VLIYSFVVLPLYPFLDCFWFGLVWVFACLQSGSALKTKEEVAHLLKIALVDQATAPDQPLNDSTLQKLVTRGLFSLVPVIGSTKTDKNTHRVVLPACVVCALDKIYNLGLITPVRFL
jgi:hypothetical protein